MKTCLTTEVCCFSFSFKSNENRRRNEPKTWCNFASWEIDFDRCSDVIRSVRKSEENEFSRFQFERENFFYWKFVRETNFVRWEKFRSSNREKNFFWKRSVLVRSVRKDLSTKWTTDSFSLKFRSSNRFSRSNLNEEKKICFPIETNRRPNSTWIRFNHRQRFRTTWRWATLNHRRDLEITRFSRRSIVQSVLISRKF